MTPKPLPPIEDDSLYDLVGIADVDPAHHDDVVYPRWLGAS